MRRTTLASFLECDKKVTSPALFRFTPSQHEVLWISKLSRFDCMLTAYLAEYEMSRPFARSLRHGQIARTVIGMWGLVGIALLVSPAPVSAQCSASGTLTPGSTVTCNGTQTSRVGQGPGADNITVHVNNGGSIWSPTPTPLAWATTPYHARHRDGPRSDSPDHHQQRRDRRQLWCRRQYHRVRLEQPLTINANAKVIATGTEQTSEAINPQFAGNHIINFGLIQGGPSSAIFFENTGLNASSPRNSVDNFGTIQLIPVGNVNPVTGGQAVGSNGAVGIDFINETGAHVIGNLDFQGGNDHVTLNPGSSITGDFDGGGGTTP